MSEPKKEDRKPLEPFDNYRTINVEKALASKKKPNWVMLVTIGAVTFVCGLLFALKLTKSERLEASIASLNGQIGALQQKIFAVNGDLRNAKSSVKWAQDRTSEKQSTINDLRRQLNPRRRRSAKNLKQYYDELIAFKSTRDFREYGLGAGGPYHRWMNEVDAKSDDQSLAFRERVGFGELLMLAGSYAATRGGESETTGLLRESIEDAISGE